MSSIKKDRAAYSGNIAAYADMNEALNWFTDQLPELSEKFNKFYHLNRV
ncbi:MAG: hypothetical protein GQ582_08710 [Methyloprofundus sp.]|nr:hypothetical protein [Methyloprofundus sp.]